MRKSEASHGATLGGGWGGSCMAQHRFASVVGIGLQRPVDVPGVQTLAAYRLHTQR